MFHKHELTQIGKLQAVQVKGQADGFCVVLFHGYGADCHDLASLSDAVSGLSGLSWVFPQGILDVPIGPGWTGKAWFPIDIAALEQAQRTGDNRMLARRRPQGMDRARSLAFDMIDQLPFPKSRIIIGGFSQGAMLATELALHSQDPFAGLILLSGTLLDEDGWKKRAQERGSFSFFQSHGVRDSVLPVELARELATMLQEAGWDGHLYEFKGAHEIPMPVIAQMGYYIRNCIKR